MLVATGPVSVVVVNGPAVPVKARECEQGKKGNNNSLSLNNLKTYWV